MEFTSEDIGMEVHIITDTQLYPVSMGKICTIPQSYGGMEYIGVDAGENFGGHSCHGNCAEGYGLYVIAEDLETLDFEI